MQQFQQQSWTSWIYKESPMPLSIVTELVVAVILVVLVFFFFARKKKTNISNGYTNIYWRHRNVLAVILKMNQSRIKHLFISISTPWVILSSLMKTDLFI